jgi:hypothetical protein
MQPREQSNDAQPQNVTEYKGLRIGKVEARESGTDNGMKYDGMYWHYLDKFIFVLCRYAKIANDRTYLEKAVTLIKELHNAFYVPGQGYYWKLNVDLRPMPGSKAHTSHDVVSAWIVFNIALQMGGDVQREVQELSPLVSR